MTAIAAPTPALLLPAGATRTGAASEEPPRPRESGGKDGFPLEALLGVGLGGLTGFAGAAVGSIWGLKGAKVGSYIGAGLGAVGGVAALAVWMNQPHPHPR